MSNHTLSPWPRPGVVQWLYVRGISRLTRLTTMEDNVEYHGYFAYVYCTTRTPFYIKLRGVLGPTDSQNAPATSAPSLLRS